MGGEGSMMAANQSLKSNRNLLAKRKDRKALNGSYAGLKIADFPEASKQDLERLRVKLLQDRRQTRKKQLLVFVFAMIFACIFFILIF